jgi:hypothetical protein
MRCSVRKQSETGGIDWARTRPGYTSWPKHMNRRNEPRSIGRLLDRSTPGSWEPEITRPAGGTLWWSGEMRIGLEVITRRCQVSSIRPSGQASLGLAAWEGACGCPLLSRLASACGGPNACHSLAIGCSSRLRSLPIWLSASAWCDSATSGEPRSDASATREPIAHGLSIISPNLAPCVLP